MKWTGPDSFKSWLISLSCCFINILMFGFARLSGVLFVASISQYNVGRQQASLPYTLGSAVRNLSGPLVGFLGYKFGVRATTSCGALLGAFGVGLCYFAENIFPVTILWGIVFGFGFGLGGILLPISINQYFEKHRATASGLSFSGACIGSFILPPVAEIFLNNYGLSQTFLLLSALLLNCVPAALLLREPDFEMQSKKLHNQKHEEKQHANLKIEKPIYTVEKLPYKHEALENHDLVKNNSALNEEESNQNYTALTYEERMKRLSTQTLLSGYSVRMSTSEPLDVEALMEISKNNRQIDLKILEVETSSSSSANTNRDGTSEKDDVFEKDSNSFYYVENESTLKQSSALSKNILFSDENQCDSYQNYSYQPDADEIHDSVTKMTNKTKDSISQTIQRKNSNSISLSEENYEVQVQSSREVSRFFHKPVNHSNSNKWAYNNSQDIIPEKQYVTETEKTSCLGSFSVFLEPIFILILVTNTIYTSSFVCMVTIIVDFSRDLHIETSKEKYVLMLLSVGDIIGRLGLGWITDNGHMTRLTFAAICFASQGLFAAAIAWSRDFTSLAVLVTLYGLAQAGLIVIFPIIIAQYIDQDKQSIAIPSYHFLTGPGCLSLAPLIGYFRDEVGAYNWIFYGIGILSAVSSLSWTVASYFIKCQKQN